MTKDEGLRLALEGAANYIDVLGGDSKKYRQLLAQPAPVQEPVAWKWHQAPVKTSWGHDMVVADLAIDKDNTVSVYCERDQTTKVEAMFNPPAAQPAPVQEPVAYDKTELNCFAQDLYDQKMREGKRGHYESMFHVIHQCVKKVAPPPAAQRQWVGLSEQELKAIWYDAETGGAMLLRFAQAIEAKLKEKNT